jgi:hypothetical protein
MITDGMIFMSELVLLAWVLTEILEAIPGEEERKWRRKHLKIMR